MARSGCIYGPTGTFKTAQVAFFARYIAETTGKATLLFSADGGGWDPCQEEVLAKMILPYRVDANLIPLPIVRKVSQGYWPENPEEPDVSQVVFRKVNWDRVGGIAVEGITSLGTMLMRNCADKNLKTGEEGTSKFLLPIRVYNEETQQSELTNEMFAQNSKGHYGFVQNQLYSLVSNFTSLPVSYVLFTAHEKRYAEDGDLQCGINVPGKAITPLVPTWIGDCIHAQDFKVEQVTRTPDPNKPDAFIEDKTVDVVCRYYFTKHVDPATGAIFEAKPRVTHSKALELRKVFPGGYFVPTIDQGFDTYLRAVDKLAKDAAAADALKDWRRRADEKLGRTPKPAPAPLIESGTFDKMAAVQEKLAREQLAKVPSSQGKS